MNSPKGEPFGYFKPDPFGWTDCAETDEGAIALYEQPQAMTLEKLTVEELVVLIEVQPLGAALNPQWVMGLAEAIQARLIEKSSGAVA